MAGFLNRLRGNHKPTDDQQNEEEFKAGQIWNYNTRPGEENSRLTVLKVETYAEGVVIHISLNGLHIHNPQNPEQFLESAGHLPFSKEAIVNSVTNLDSEGNALPDFMEGYLAWKQAFDARQAGVFSDTVSKAVSYMEEAMSNAKPSEEN